MKSIFKLISSEEQSNLDIRRKPAFTCQKHKIFSTAKMFSPFFRDCAEKIVTSERKVYFSDKNLILQKILRFCYYFSLRFQRFNSDNSSFCLAQGSRLRLRYEIKSCTKVKLSTLMKLSVLTRPCLQLKLSSRTRNLIRKIPCYNIT